MSEQRLRRRCRLTFFASLLLALPCPARPQETTQTVGDIHVQSMRLAEIDAAHLRVEVHLAVVPADSATLTGVRWSGLRFNGVPVFGDPMDTMIALHKGQTAALPPLFLTIMVRDLSSTQPLRDAVQSGHARIEGEAVAALQLNFLEKLALHTQQPRVRIPFFTEVPVEIPGGFVGRQAALGFLRVADGAIASRNAAGRLPYLNSGWRQHAEAEARQNLFLVESVYAVHTKGAGGPVAASAIGFRLDNIVVTTAEMHAPWQFDPDFLTRIQAHEANPVPDSLHVTLRPLNGSGLLPVSALDERGPQAKDALIVHDGHYATIEPRRRATPGSLLILRTAAGGGWPLAPAAVLARPAWQAIVFRLHPGTNGAAPTVDAVQLTVERDPSGGLRFDHPVDASAFGSPLLTPEGIIGMVQDERAGTLLDANSLPH